MELNPGEMQKETIWCTFQSLLNVAQELLHVHSLMLKRFFRYLQKIFPGYDRGNWTLPHLLPLKVVERKEAAFGQQWQTKQNETESETEKQLCIGIPQLEL